MYYRSLRARDTWHLKSWMKCLHRGQTAVIKEIKFKDLIASFPKNSLVKPKTKVGMRGFKLWYHQTKPSFTDSTSDSNVNYVFNSPSIAAYLSLSLDLLSYINILIRLLLPRISKQLHHAHKPSRPPHTPNHNLRCHAPYIPPKCRFLQHFTNP
jgi:hypothetical protein